MTVTLPPTTLIPSGPHPPSATAKPVFSREQIELIKRTICAGATDDELALFIEVAKRTGLDPFQRQIHAVKRFSKKEGREVMQIQVGIDGHRLTAYRTGNYAPGPEPTFVTEHGKPVSATAYVRQWIRGEWHQVPATARWDEFCQRGPGGEPTVMWQRMPFHMLAKVAEALALRKAFPAELAGTYLPEEIHDEAGYEGRLRRATRAYAAAGERPGVAASSPESSASAAPAGATLPSGGGSPPLAPNESMASSAARTGVPVGGAEAALVPGVAVAIDPVQHARNLVHDAVDELLAAGVTRQAIGAAKMRAAGALKVFGASKMTIDDMPAHLLDAFAEELQKIARPADKPGEAGDGGDVA